MVKLLKIKRRNFFQLDSIPSLVSRTVKNCCILEMKHASGLETCTKIYFLFIVKLDKFVKPRCFDFAI